MPRIASSTTITRCAYCQDFVRLAGEHPCSGLQPGGARPLPEIVTPARLTALQQVARYAGLYLNAPAEEAETWRAALVGALAFYEDTLQQLA